MKLATLHDGSRDGQLVVVSRDLSSAHYATGIAAHLQQVLDDWNFFAPQLQDVYDALNSGKARHAFAFDPHQCMAPLPRAHGLLHGQAYGSHARMLGLPSPAAPALQAELAHDLAGPRDDLALRDPAWDMDFAAELAVVAGDLPAGAAPEQALEAVRLLMLGSGISLRACPPGGQVLPLGTAFAPVAVTPDELGTAWRDGRAHVTVQTSVNGRKLGLGDAGQDMDQGFGDLLATAARARRLRAGVIVCSGPISHPAQGDGAQAPAGLEWPKGHGCIAEKRAMETQLHGAAQTPYLQWGDSLRVEARGAEVQALWGAIELSVVEPGV